MGARPSVDFATHGFTEVAAVGESIGRGGVSSLIRCTARKLSSVVESRLFNCRMKWVEVDPLSEVKVNTLSEVEISTLSHTTSISMWKNKQVVRVQAHQKANHRMWRKWSLGLFNIDKHFEWAQSFLAPSQHYTHAWCWNKNDHKLDMASRLWSLVLYLSLTKKQDA